MYEMLISDQQIICVLLYEAVFLFLFTLFQVLGQFYGHFRDIKFKELSDKYPVQSMLVSVYV